MQSKKIKGYAILINVCVALVCLIALFGGQSHAMWYEAKGRAIILNGDKETAKREAIEEALKQAMLFSGASIKSVQQLTNGLLENEEMTIRSTGEVEQLEIIDERYNGEVFTVSIRADIFPATQQCAAISDIKRFATTHFLIPNRRQLTEGNIRHLDEAVTKRFADLMANTTDTLRLSYIAPHTAKFKSEFTEQNVRSLSQRGNSQFVIVGTIDDLSIKRKAASVFTPWADDSVDRYFGMTLHVFDGINGGKLFTKSYSTHAQWTFDRFAQIDEFSNYFWHSTYGREAQKLMLDAIQDLKEATACQPVTGRVINVAGDIISISLGRDNGLQDSDELVLYQAKEVMDNKGKKYLQYSLYPGVFVVENTFANSSTIIHKNSGLVANIQENDFVVKK
ncbi:MULTISPECIES: flagellar assembly protein T N-terminal domain-containing protein [unclassified Alteromonas]|uniref:flagellar assembly protein T N-terminal domain-containing protein n=1 Tax=unclassified Alteromonas TaxID=2614992 RepID=UPI000509ABE8|nr:MULTISPECIES: flagellar assembly protein T N-terminal domain-containing protein [unclassified Alteromonas]